MLKLPGRVGFLQFNVKTGAWEDNLAQVRAGLRRLRPRPGTLVLLPELWSCGYDYDNLLAHAARSPSLLEALAQEAGALNISLAGSLPESVGGQGVLYNTLFLVDNRGVRGGYRKRHLFAPLGERDHFTPGTDPLRLLAPKESLGALVCFDLRFPELAVRQASQGAGLILVAAQWPTARLHHWRTLLQARAIENQLFVAACNRCGTSGGTEFAGHSMIIAPDGAIVVEAGAGPCEMAAEITATKVAAARELFSTVTPGYRLGLGELAASGERLAKP